ncbi:hypothetical protein [Streptomyces sp. bgisy084]
MDEETELPTLVIGMSTSRAADCCPSCDPDLSPGIPPATPRWSSGTR